MTDLSPITPATFILRMVPCGECDGKGYFFDRHTHPDDPCLSHEWDCDNCQDGQVADSCNACLKVAPLNDDWECAECAAVTGWLLAERSAVRSAFGMGPIDAASYTLITIIGLFVLIQSVMKGWNW